MSSPIDLRVADALVLMLTDQVEAVLIRRGEPWNGLVEYRCVAPAAFAGERLIASICEGPGTGDTFSDLIETLARIPNHRRLLIATPKLVAALRAIQSCDEGGQAA